MDDFNPDIHTFEGQGEGVSFTVLGAIHGNEHCGPEAINKIINLIESGDIKITNGKLTLMPICNPRAYKQKVRFTERNLNRFMFPKDEPKDYEDHLDNIICPVLEKTDYLLDLHSYSSQGESFIFLGQLNEKNLSFARSLGTPRFIYGWADALGGADDLADPRIAIGTTEYTRDHGGTALTLECGHHANEDVSEVAFNAILGALEHLGIAEFDPALKGQGAQDTYNIRMQGAFVKKKEGSFTQQWTNMHPVKKGDIIARYDDGEEVIMSADGYIVLPMYDPTIGDGWFYWGVEDPLDE